MIRNGLRVRAKGAAKEQVEAASPIDADLVRQLAQLVTETGLAEIEIEKGDLRIRLTRQHRAARSAPVAVEMPAASHAALPPMQAAAAPPAPTGVVDADHPGLLKSPMVGTVYRRANPESKPFVEVGMAVKAGDRVLLVEAMKTFNDIVAHKTGTIAAILIEDSQPVEYNEPLLLID